MAVKTWVRTRRQNPVTGVRVPGPWHVALDGLTLCGKRPGRLVSSQRSTDPAVTHEGTLCPVCVRNAASGKRTPYKRG